jgi:hypothetical protein
MFEGISSNDTKPPEAGKEMSANNAPFPISGLNANCVFTTQHNADFSVTVFLHPNYVEFPQQETLFINIFKKIFSRVKGFIENIK